MADVRGASGIPTLGAFGGLSSPTPSTPLYVDLATGDLYVVISEVVTLVGSIAGGSSFTIANQSFGQHFKQLGDVADANQNMATRSFAAKPSGYVDNSDANQTLATRAFAVRYGGYTDNSDVNQTLETRVFRQRDTTPQAVFGDSSSILAQLAFQPRPRPAFWS